MSTTTHTPDDRTYRISGRVIDRDTGAGLAGLRIEAWDKDLIFDDWVGRSETDADGYFEMTFTESAFAGVFLDRRPDLFFRIYRAHKRLWSTENSVLWNMKSDAANILIELYEGGATAETTQAANIHLLLELLSQIDVSVWPLKVHSHGEPVHKLHLVLAGLGYSVPPVELVKWVFGAGTQWIIRQVQEASSLENTGALDVPTKKTLEQMLIDASTRYHAVEGRAFFDNGSPANEVALRLYLHGLGGAAQNAAGECETDRQGFYFLTYYPQSKAVNFEIRALDRQGQEIALTRPISATAKYEVMDLVVPTKDVRREESQSEFQRIMHDLTKQLGDWHRLAEIREVPEQRDLTFLHQTTGWDARLIALASIAVRTSEEIAGDARLPANGRPSPACLYALIRTGLPYDRQLLAELAQKTVEDALALAIDAGIVSAAEVAGSAEAFALFSKIVRRDAKGAVALSSVGELLDCRSGDDVPADERLTEEEKQTFEDLYFTTDSTNGELWVEAAKKGIPKQKIDGLKLQGKLAYLTQDNAILTHHLQSYIGSLENLSHLAKGRLYESASWQRLIRWLVRDKGIGLESFIPAGYLGDTVDERLGSYAADLASKVRSSFPTDVVSSYIARGNEPGGLNLGSDHAKLQPVLCTFLDKAAQLDFRLGTMHVEAFVEKHEAALFKGIDAGSHGVIVDTVKRLHRLRQVAPNDQAMVALNRLGFASAQEIASIPQQTFIAQFGREFNLQGLASSRQWALEIHDKAQQIRAITLSMATTMASLESSPGFFAVSGTPERRGEESTQLANSVRDYPTTWSLFGSQDFCECQHCRSVLSPAAYFADLLKFLEPNAKEWDSTMANWMNTHCAAYPFQTAEKWHSYLSEWTERHPEEREERPPTDWTPYDILVGRRPDLPHISLSCENTNTALPYIDLVNEILEYHVAHGSLAAAAARDTGQATTPTLLAEPQNVIAGAYTTLRGAKYPLVLPFDLWLETVRRFFDHFQTPLWRVLEVFRKTDELFDSTNTYDRAAIFREYLGISPAERAIFSTPASEWFTLFGFSQAPKAGTLTFRENGRDIDLQSARSLARRLGVSYRELADLVSVGPRTGCFLTGWQPGTGVLLQPPASGCDFDKTTLVIYPDGSPVAAVYLRMNLFVRLWKKLGWSMDEVDQALQVFLPPGSSPLNSSTLGAGLDTVLVYLAHLKALDELLKPGKNGRQMLLGLWSSSSTTRQADLARVLKLPPGDLTALKRLSGLDPFKALAQAPLDKLLDDYPFSQTLRFVEVADKVRKSGFSVEDIDYLICHRFDPVGKYRENTDTLMSLVRTLTTGLRRIREEHAEPEDSLCFSDDAIKRELALLAPTEVVETFTSMWTGTIEYSAAVSKVKAKDRLDPAALASERTITLTYDSKAEVQGLTIKGVLVTEEITRLVSTYNLPLLPTLLAQIRTKAEDFFEAHLSGILAKELIDSLFFAATHSPTQQEEEDRRRKVASSILPLIHKNRIFVIETLATSLSVDPVIVETLLTNAEVLVDPTAGGTSGPLLDAFKVLGVSGVSADSYDGTASNAKLLSVQILPHGEFANPGNAAKVLLAAWFEVPTSGDYHFFVSCADPSASLQLRLSHLPDSLIDIDNATGEFEGVTPLKAGVPYHFELTANNPKGKAVSLLVMAEKLPKGALNRLTLYPGASVERARRSFVLLSKTLQLIKTFQFNDRELQYLWRHYRTTVSLAQLPIQLALPKAPPDPSASLFNLFLQLADYASLKREIASGTDDLIGLFEQASRTKTDLQDVCTSVARLTRRTSAIVAVTATELGLKTADFADVTRLQRLWDALQVVERIGTSAANIARWSSTVVSPTSDDTEKKNIAEALKNAVKALYATETWERVAQAIFDPLRQKKRDALVVYILHHNGFDSLEQLFEYFLIDPGMEPVVQTSRIRLAISSVQTFIQRCLLNLEPYVSPSAINSQQWEWMKRYRVWEANRKIFLYPENWLEPEFRDDKTHLFQNLESSLLQGDLSNESAEDAFHSYLEGLEEIARLDIATMCREQRETPDQDIIHVIGRTQNKPGKYFYRRHANAMWTPWEPLTIPIESNHVVASIWRGRLYLFWVTFTRKATAPAPVKLKPDMDTPKSQEQLKIQLHWCQYSRGQWISSQYNDFENTATAFVVENTEFLESKVFVHIEKDESPYGETLTVHINAANLLGQILPQPDIKALNSALVEAAYAANKAHTAQPSMDLQEFHKDIKKALSAISRTKSMLSNLKTNSITNNVQTNQGQTNKPPAPNMPKEYIDQLNYAEKAAEDAEKKTNSFKDAVERLELVLKGLKPTAETINNEAKLLLELPRSTPEEIDAVNKATSNVAAKWENFDRETQTKLNELDLTLPLGNFAVVAGETAVNCSTNFYNQQVKLNSAIKPDENIKEASASIRSARDKIQNHYDLGCTAKTQAKRAVSIMHEAVKATEKAVQAAKDHLDNYLRPPLSFVLSGRHAPPKIEPKKKPPDLLYAAQPDRITLYKADGSSLSKKEQDGLQVAENLNSPPVKILARTDSSDVHLLPCGADKLVGSVDDRQKRLYSPLFFIDEENTFYVDTVWAKSAPIADYQGYASSGSSSSMDKPLPALPPKEYMTSTKPVKDGTPVMGVEIEQLTSAQLLHTISQESNWVTKQETLVAFGSTVVSSNGGVTLTGVANQNSVVASHSSAASNALLGKLSGQHVNSMVVGSSGLNAATLKTTR